LKKERYEHIKKSIHLLKVDEERGAVLNKSEWRSSTGYLAIHLNKKQVPVHQIIAFLKYGELCIGLEVNHIDGDKNNNKPENLSLVTREENMKHAYEKGLCSVNRTRLSEKEISEIRKLLSDGYTQKAISEKYRTSITTISRIKRGIHKKTSKKQASFP